MVSRKSVVKNVELGMSFVASAVILCLLGRLANSLPGLDSQPSAWRLLRSDDQGRMQLQKSYSKPKLESPAFFLDQGRTFSYWSMWLYYLGIYHDMIVFTVSRLC